MFCQLLLISAVMTFCQSTLLCQESTPKKRVRISLSSTSITDSILILSAKVLTKEGRSYIPLQGVPVQFYADSTYIGESPSDELGLARINVPRNMLTSEFGPMHLEALITDQDSLRDASRDLDIAMARIDLDMYTEEDSLHFVRARLTAPDSLGYWSGVPDQPVRLFVKRLFGQLQIDEGFELTDEEGIVVVQFPDDIHGDPLGNVDIVAELQDHEDFGTVKATKKADWGIPLAPTDMTRRELWSSGANAPIYLSVIVNGIVLVIWGFIVYVFARIFKIWKNGRELSTIN